MTSRRYECTFFSRPYYGPREVGYITYLMSIYRRIILDMKFEIATFQRQPRISVNKRFSKNIDSLVRYGKRICDRENNRKFMVYPAIIQTDNREMQFRYRNVFIAKSTKINRHDSVLSFSKRCFPILFLCCTDFKCKYFPLFVVLLSSLNGKCRIFVLEIQ